MDGYITIGTKLDTKDFEKEIKYVESQLDEIKDKLKQADMGFEVGDTQKLEMQYEKLSRKLSVLYQKQKDLNKSDMSGLKNSIKEVGEGISGVIHKVTRWGLAIFGVRSAYLAIRRATSLVSQSNEEIAGKLEGIQLFFASAFEPVVERIVNLVYKLLTYVNYIAKAWFGVDLFAKASEKSMKGSAKAAKDLKKFSAGFDEMNVVQSQKGGGSAGGGGAKFPEPKDVPIPKWLEWIAKHKDLILGFLATAGILIAALKIGQLFAGLGQVGVVLGGIATIVGGLILFIKGIIDYLKNPTWENFKKILGGIALIAAGVLLIFGGFPALITLIIGLVVALGVAIYKNWGKIKATLSKVGTWIYDHIIKPVGDFFSGLWQGIKDGVGSAVNWVKEKFWSIVGFFNGLISKIVGLFKTIGTKVGNVIGGAFKAVINGVLHSIESILNFPIKSINKLTSVINKVPGINIGKLPTFKLPRLATGGIINMPGRGVPIGGAIAGEAGREGVIPLTDQNAMAQLGQEIARNVRINLTDIIQVNSRQLARILKEVKSENDFAMNG